MSIPVGTLPRLVRPLPLGLASATTAMGHTVVNLEHVKARFALRNGPEPQAMIAGVIMLLLACSLSILIVGYAMDATRPEALR